jgi:uncharacterized membrane protein SpoIIM required for sporulation
MRQEVFERSRAESWKRIESALLGLERGLSAEADAFPSLYRALCQDLALARERGFSASLVEKLNGLALRGHEQLYGAERERIGPLLRSLFARVPRSVAAHRRALWFATLVFTVGSAVSAWHSYRDEKFVYSVYDAHEVAAFESMYSGAPEIVEDLQDSDSRTYMFGFYIYNNISIDFTTFGLGLLFGVGSMFILAANAVYLGTVAGHLFHKGFGNNLASFVVGHGAFELPALWVSAAAGFALGLAWIAPGRRSRLASLRAAAHSAQPLVGLAGVMGVIAAALEAFWSPLAIGAAIKYTVGAALWTLVLVGFLVLGQRRAD